MKLYRYQPINKNTLINLSLQCNWSADPFLFNDPFEFPLRSEWYLNEASTMKLLDEKHLKIRKQVEDQIKNFGVVSYSEKRQNKLIWSHYGDHHKGMCLGFDFELDNIPALKKIKYNETIPEFDFEEDPWNLDSGISQIIYTKSKDWEYENEWREILPEKNKHYLYSGKLTEVSFGCKCPIDDIEMIFSILIPLYKNEIKFSKYFIQKDTFNVSESLGASKDETFLPKETLNYWEIRSKK